MADRGDGAPGEGAPEEIGRQAVRVVLIDDHPLWREGVTAILGADPAFEVIGQGGSADEAVRLAGDLLPDLMLLDVSMPGGGLNAARAIALTYPVVKLIMLTVAREDETVLAALKAGARGYVLKGVSGPELLRIVRGVQAGETYITPELAAALLVDSQDGGAGAGADPLATLSEREREILSRLARGMSNRQIADDLHLSEKTIKHYMTNILQKLHVRNRVEAALLAQKAIHPDG